MKGGKREGAGRPAAPFELTLHDYFAAQAMNALIAQSHAELCAWLDESSEGSMAQTNNVLAKVSYELADAMMHARTAQINKT